MEKVFFGFDPGGQGNFGWAVLRIKDKGNPVEIETGVVSTAPDAVKAAYDAAGGCPNAVGIDAPLFWSMHGDRKVDEHIRARDGVTAGQVMAVNSLRGACLVQGVLTAKIIHEKFPTRKVTETHPKVLLNIFADSQAFIDKYLPNPNSEHERDALVSSYCAWAMEDRFQDWSDLFLLEIEPFIPSKHEVHYWFPDQI